MFLKIDYKNAFNSSERDRMLHGVKSRSPLLYKYFWQCYAEPTLLSFDSNIILSAVGAQGAQQGDPAGGFLFSLSLQPVINEIEADLNLWYLDDGSLCDEPDIVLDDLKRLIQSSKHLGLEVIPSKCELYFCSGQVDDDVLQKFQDIAPGIRVVNDENLNLLGVPIFESGFQEVAASWLRTASSTFDRLKNLPAHTAYFLLRNCFAIPKLTCFVRTFPVWKFSDFISTFDALIRTTLETVLNVKLDDIPWIQATLPVSLGGLGIRQVNDISLPAFLGSTHGSAEIVSHIFHNSDEIQVSHLTESLKAWSIINSSLPSSLHNQHSWDSINASRIVANELNPTNLYDIARLKALQHRESNAWLNAYPSKHIGTFMDNNSLRICTALRLGSVICRQHRCICGTMVDHFGRHGLACQKSAGRHARHCELNKIICQALCSINVPATLEPPGMCRNDGKRPDGLTLTPWSNGMCLVWDATCCDTFADSYVRSSSMSAGRAAESAARYKHDLYSEIENSNYIFVAFAAETMGTWCAEALSLANKIGSKLVESSGDRRANEYFFQRISMAIQRANAACIMGSIPSTTRLDEIYYL